MATISISLREVLFDHNRNNPFSYSENVEVLNAQLNSFIILELKMKFIIHLNIVLHKYKTLTSCLSTWVLVD